ncbi:MAG: homoserine O-succinyltransferase [Planctomycetes bacterium]|nr:homoserine O-succinyltransferase [Planctomycetota bacterium]
MATRRTVRGELLDGAQLAFERQGPEHAPVVVVLGGISAGRHVSAHAGVPGPGWWEGFVGDGLAVDTRRLSVLSIDWLGGNGCSTAPGRGECLGFVGAEDQADALVELLDRLRIERVHTVIGSSYGGMVGLQLAARHPQRLQQLVAIAAAHRSHPQASAWRAVQRGIVALGAAAGHEAQALSLARQLAMTTYRSPQELAARFSAAPTFGAHGVSFPVEGWLQARGEAFAAAWTSEQFLCLCSSIDAHLVDPAAVAAPTTLVSFASDQLVPVADVRELARALPRLVRHVELASPYGHDAFLKERSALSRLLREVLA